MKLPDLSKYFRSIRQIKIEDLRFSSLTDLNSSNNISFGTFKDTFLAFVSIKRNRLIISSGIASIFLLSLLPQKIELLINRKSMLSEYTSEALLLDDLQNEVISVESTLGNKTLAKTRILELIPSKQEAEKVLPIILTNLTNSSSLRLVEILPSNETSYLTNSDEELFEDFVDLNDIEEPLDDEEFLSEDDFEFEDAGAPTLDNDNEFTDEFTDEFGDPFPEDESLSDLSSSSPDESSISSLFYTVKVQGEPQSLYNFFENLHTIKLLYSIGTISYNQEPSVAGIRDGSISSQSSLAASTPLNTITMDFTLKVAVQSLSEIPTPLSNGPEFLPLDGDDGLYSITDIEPQNLLDLPSPPDID